jgi:hypothetical protein
VIIFQGSVWSSSAHGENALTRRPTRWLSYCVYIITAVWTGAFALMVVTDLLILFVPSLPTFVAILVTVLAIWGGAQFTSWYPERELVRRSR